MADQQLQANRVGVIAKAPEIFKLKNNFNSWLKQFRNYAELVNVQANNMYQTFMSFMDEESFSVVESLTLTPAQRNAFFDNATILLISEAIKNRQGERIPAEFMLRFRKQEDNESIEQYASALEKIALEAFPNDANIRQNRQLIQSFLMGIKNDELGIKLLEQNFDNLTNALNYATQYFKALQTRRYIKREGNSTLPLEKVYNVSPEQCYNCRQAAETVNKTQKVDNTSKYHLQQAPQMTTEMPNLQQHVQLPLQSGIYYNQAAQPLQNQMPIGNFTQAALPMMSPHVNPIQQFRYNSRNANRKNVQCYNCGKSGHYKSECRSMNNNNYNKRARPQRPYCTYCSKPGHIAATCFHLNPQLIPGNTQKQHANVTQNEPNSKNPFRAQ